MPSAPANRLPIADVLKGVFKQLAGDGCAVLPIASARSRLAQVVVRPVHNLAEPTLQSRKVELVDACKGSFHPLRSRVKPARSHPQAIYKPFASQVQARCLGDAFVFASYSLRISLVFSSYSPLVSRWSPPPHPGGCTERLLGFDRRGLAVIQTESRF